MKNQAVKFLPSFTFRRSKSEKTELTVLFPLFLVCFVFGYPSIAAAADESDKTAWHHAPSPYRAVFSVENFPSRSRAGVALQVPSCGLGGEREGRDFFAYTESGRQLPLLTLGRGLRNRSLVLIRIEEKDSAIYLYFGSNFTGPQNRTAFRPSLLTKVHALPPRFSVNNWRQARNLIEEAPLLGSYFEENIALAHNPINSRQNFGVDFSGHFHIEKAGEYIFTLISENAGYLLINDSLLIERSENATADRESRQGKSHEKINLRRGLHSIRCVVLNKGGRLTAMVGRIQEDSENSAEKLTLLQPDFFLHPGRTELQEVQTRTSEPKPLFDYEIIAYIGYEDQIYHLVKLWTLTGIKGEWRLDNNIQSRGESVEIIVPGIADRRLLIKHEDRELTGTINFPEKEPPRKSIENREDFQRFVETMAAVPLEVLDTSTLLAYHQFIRYHQAHSKLAETARILNRRNELRAEEKKQVQLDLARTTDDLNQADTAYRQLLRTAEEEEEQQMLFLEFYEFLLFRRNESAEAEQILSYLKNQDILSSDDIALLRIDLEMAREDPEKAGGIIEEILRSRNRLRNQRQDLIKGEVLERKFYSHLNQKLLEEAWKIIRQWQKISPYHRNSGDFHLARARLFRAYGWHQAALREINRSLTSIQQMNRKPELELEKVNLLRKIGKNNTADELEEKIQEQYPNHPAVE